MDTKVTERRPCILAVDVGGTFLKSALFSQSGEMLSEGVDETPVDSDGAAKTIERVFREVTRRIAARAAQMGAVVRGVGVSVPGPFDYEQGRFLMDHKYASVKGACLRPWFTDTLGNVPIRFLHDAAACLLGLMGEPETGCYSRVAVATLGTGLGFALSIDGKVQTNARGGPAVSLFNRPYRDGIAEDYVSRRGILARYRRASGQDEALDVVDIAALAQKNDADALRVFRETGTMLGEILRPVLIEQRIECLVIGGQISAWSSGDRLHAPAVCSKIPCEPPSAAFHRCTPYSRSLTSPSFRFVALSWMSSKMRRRQIRRMENAPTARQTSLMHRPRDKQVFSRRISKAHEMKELGVVAPIVTPCSRSGEPNPDGVRAVCDDLFGAGIHGIFIASSIGRGP